MIKFKKLIKKVISPFFPNFDCGNYNIDIRKFDIKLEYV